MYKRTMIAILATTMVASPIMNGAQAFDDFTPDELMILDWELEREYQERRRAEKKAAKAKARKEAARRKRKRQKKQDREDLITLGILGLVAGAAILGSSNDKQARRPVQQRPNRRSYDSYKRKNPRVVYSTQFKPWTPEWYDHCRAKYRSFNPRTGYFFGYDGKYHFCR